MQDMLCRRLTGGWLLMSLSMASADAMDLDCYKHLSAELVLHDCTVASGITCKDSSGKDRTIHMGDGTEWKIVTADSRECKLARGEAQPIGDAPPIRGNEDANPIPTEDDW